MTKEETPSDGVPTAGVPTAVIGRRMAEVATGDAEEPRAALVNQLSDTTKSRWFQLATRHPPPGDMRALYSATFVAHCGKRNKRVIQE